MKTNEWIKDETRMERSQIVRMTPVKSPNGRRSVGKRWCDNLQNTEIWKKKQASEVYV